MIINIVNMNFAKVKIYKGLFRILIAVLVFSSQMACAELSVEQSAEAYCMLYEPDNWGVSIKDAGFQEVYSAIVTRQKNTPLASDIKKAITDADTSGFAEFYYSVNRNIESVLGKPWECQAFQNFYLPTQTLVTLNLGGTERLQIDPSSIENVIITLTYNGTILINNSALKISNSSSIQAAIQSIMGHENSEKNVIVYFDEGSDAGKAASIFRALSDVGIRQVQLIDYN